MVIHSQGSCLIWRQPISNWHGANNKRNWRNQHADVFTSLRVYKPPCVIAFDSVWLNSDKRWLSVHGYSAPGNRSIYASPGLISLSQFPMAGQEMCLDKKPATWFGKKKTIQESWLSGKPFTQMFIVLDFHCCVQTFCFSWICTEIQECLKKQSEFNFKKLQGSKKGGGVMYSLLFKKCVDLQTKLFHIQSH